MTQVADAMKINKRRNIGFADMLHDERNAMTNETYDYIRLIADHIDYVYDFVDHARAIMVNNVISETCDYPMFIADADHIDSA